MSPQEINDKILATNKDISNIMDLLNKERRPKHIERNKNSIRLKIKELIRLEIKRSEAQH